MDPRHKQRFKKPASGAGLFDWTCFTLLSAMLSVLLRELGNWGVRGGGVGSSQRTVTAAPRHNEKGADLVFLWNFMLQLNENESQRELLQTISNLTCTAQSPQTFSEEARDALYSEQKSHDVSVQLSCFDSFSATKKNPIPSKKICPLLPVLRCFCFSLEHLHQGQHLMRRR